MSKDKKMPPLTDDDRESVLSRLPWLLAMEAVLLVVLAYPLRIKDEWRTSILSSLNSRWGSHPVGALLIGELEALISFMLSPLVFKGILATACAFGVLAVILAGKVLEPAPVAATPKPLRARFKYPAYLLTLLFLLWSAVTALWSPTRDLSLGGLPWLIGIGGLAYVLLRRGIAFEEARQFSLLLVLLGAVAAIISILEATELFHGAIFKIFLRFDDARNVHGSILGHNTAAASFLLLTCFPSLAFAISARNWRRQLPWLVYLGLALFAIIVTQSRAIWIFGALLIPAYLLFGALRFGARRPIFIAPILLGALAIGLVTQAVDVPWNPLYMKDNPLGRRLKDLSPEKLKEEARLRLLICSIPLVQEKPLFGWGLSSFQFIYPKAQAEYFALHPDSKLGLTIRRSDMAHDEYLQVAVEEGAIGLILFLLALAEVLRNGLRAGRGIPSRERLFQWAMGFSALGVALHAFVDFPFHVPQLLVPWIVCMACFGSIRPEFSATADQSESEQSNLEEEDLDDTRLRAGNVIRLIAVWVVLFLIPLTAYPLVRSLQADSEFVRASSYLELINQQGQRMPPPQQLHFIHEAMDRLHRTLRLQPFHEQARYILAEAYYLQARALAQQDANVPQPVSTPNFPAIDSAKSAIEAMNESLKSLRYHDAYYMLALYNGLLARLTPAPESKQYEREFADNLRLAIYYAPAHVTARYQLVEFWMASQPHPDIAAIVAMRRDIRRYDPFFFFKNYETRVNDSIKNHDFDAAVVGAEALLQVDGGNPDYLRPAIWADVMMGTPKSRQRALQLIAQFRDLQVDLKKYPLHPYWGSFSGLFEAIIQSDWRRARSELAHHGAAEPKVRAMLTATERILNDRIGPPLFRTKFPKPEQIPDTQWNEMVTQQRPGLLYRLFASPGEAKTGFEQEASKSGAAPPPEFWIDYADLAISLGDTTTAKHCIDELKTLSPAHPMVAKLLKKVETPATAADVLDQPAKSPGDSAGKSPARLPVDPGGERPL